MAGINAFAGLVLAPGATAQVPVVPPPATQPPLLSAPALRATGVTIALRVRGAMPGVPVRLQRHTGGRWGTIMSAPAGADGAVALSYRPAHPRPRLRLRAEIAFENLERAERDAGATPVGAGAPRVPRRDARGSSPGWS